MKRFALLAIIFLLSINSLLAREGEEDSTKLMMEQLEQYVKLRDSVHSAMKYETGVVTLPAGIIKLNIPAGFKYLGKEQSKYVIEELWGNLPQDGLQGMLFPENGNPLADSSYAYIISYEAVGYVKDADAKDIDYDDLLKGMKEGDVEGNKQREAMGGYKIFTQGWAAKPYYDETKKVLHWAIELSTDNSDEHTLNYNIIALGRKGMLTMNAIGSMDQLTFIKKDVDKVLGMASYTEGNKYSDFDSNVDEVAAWTVGGLVAGKILAKTVAGAGILKFLKFIILGVVALGGGIWKWISSRRKKKEEEFVYEPVRAPGTEEQNNNPTV